MLFIFVCILVLMDTRKIFHKFIHKFFMTSVTVVASIRQPGLRTPQHSILAWYMVLFQDSTVLFIKSIYAKSGRKISNCQVYQSYIDDVHPEFSWQEPAQYIRVLWRWTEKATHWCFGIQGHEFITRWYKIFITTGYLLVILIFFRIWIYHREDRCNRN